ncbi:TIGR04219 family outer membrane beta-barrel protein [Shewanella sp. VB17]|uniref:TIGR04219 family outer membrane beta-barrel protein n=1 Tax=Shewanella sp. VB17 TaxID=2739432 RepID=UPI001566E85A|nr:TIGR04219 family outer membrane beta-barrel protein [Shewanella sp. VB17]NRD72737.1 TIGR04219 family outer membrane beta-barrel protein [Shewanella sp. VB17]
MKKTILACALLGSLAFSSAHAESLMVFKVGGDYWKADTSGTFAENGQAQQDVNYSSSSQGSIWVSFEHPIPLVPNVKIRENRLDSDGSGSFNGDFNGHAFSGDVNVNTDLSNTDFVLYYELLNNDLVELDLGAAYKRMSGSFRVADAGHPEQKDLDSGITMAYADAQVGVPGLGLYGFAEVMLGIDESSVYDYTVGLGWQFDGDALDTKVRVGYREFNFDVNDFDGVSTNSQFKGFFAGVELVF